MKQQYYVNDHPQSNGDHEVHVPNCRFYHLMRSKTYLGEFDSCREAVRVAKVRYPTANGCIVCCTPCHTR